MTYIQNDQRLHQGPSNFLEMVFARCDLAATLTRNNGPQLVVVKFSSYTQSKGIKHIRTVYYHTQVQSNPSSPSSGLLLH
jgi:hypothetical protein